MRLFRTLQFGFSGGQTQFLDYKMQKFIPTGEESIHRILVQLYDRREYLPFNTPSFQYFVASIEKFYVNQRQFDRKSLRIYELMQKMQMMSDTTKGIFHKNICRYLSSEKTIESIKNQKLEAILWWLYREFPFQRRKFEEIASNYTIRLYDVFEYMNSVPKLPAWQPYIRVSYMLKVLGHEVECRTDMFNQQILQTIQRHYYIYLIQLFREQKYPELQKQLKIHQPLLEYLCDHYTLGDDIEYDKYLQRIEVIDNIAANEEVNCTMDAISWVEFCDGWRLATHSYQNRGLSEVHQYKFTEMFWRKLQTIDIPVQQITRMLRLMIDNPTMFFEKRQSIIMRMAESLFEKKDEDIEFFPANGFKELIKLPEYLPMDGVSVKKLSNFLYGKIPSLLNWEQGDAEQILVVLQKRQFENKDKIIQFLNKKAVSFVQ